MLQRNMINLTMKREHLKLLTEHMIPLSMFWAKIFTKKALLIYLHVTCIKYALKNQIINSWQVLIQLFSLSTYKYNQTTKKLRFASNFSFPTTHLCLWKKLLTISKPIQQAINMFMKITGASESLPLSKLEVHFRGLPFLSLFITSFWSAFIFLLFLLYFGYWLCCFSRSTLESLLKKMEQLPHKMNDLIQPHTKLSWKESGGGGKEAMRVRESTRTRITIKKPININLVGICTCYFFNKLLFVNTKCFQWFQVIQTNAIHILQNKDFLRWLH